MMTGGCRSATGSELPLISALQPKKRTSAFVDNAQNFTYKEIAVATK